MPKPSSKDGIDQQTGAGIQRLAIRRLDVPDVTHASGQRGTGQTFEPGAGVLGRLSGEHELRNRAPFASRFAICDQPLVRVEQAADVLPWLERAEEQDVAVRRPDLVEATSPGAPGGQIGDAVARCTPS